MKGDFMFKKDQVLTTGQVAEICKVAPRTVTKWFDSGKLKGYRIPGSRDRRIPAGELVRFMKANKMPVDEIEAGTLRVLVIDSDWHSLDSLAGALADKTNYDIHTADNSFDVGFIAHKIIPHVILINLMAEKIDAAQLCRQIHSNEDLQSCKVLAMGPKLGENEKNALLEKGFDDAVSNNGELSQLITAIEHASAIIY